jgi:ABC-type nitrate/sulfonate/bicarbonate transport system permease component
MNARGRILPDIRGLSPLLVGLALWQIEGTANSPTFPPPATWWRALGMLGRTGVLWPALETTLAVILLSLGAAAVAGFAVGLLIGTHRSLRQWTHYLLEYMRVLPPPIIIPIVVLMLGYTVPMKLVVITFAALWSILLNTVSGVSQIGRLQFDVARALRLSWLDALVKIVTPATVPAFLLGPRVALPQAVIATLVTEMFTGATGIGGLMMDAQRNYNAPAVFGLLALMGLVGFSLTASFALLERAVMRRWPTAR